MRVRNFVPLLWIHIFLTLPLATADKPSREVLSDGRVKESGLVIPLDGKSMYVRNSQRQVEVRWTNNTRVALRINTRQFRNIKDGVLRFRVPASSQIISFNIPTGPVTGIKPVRNADRELKEANEEKWISEFGLVLKFNKKQVHQSPTKQDPKFVGSYTFRDGPNTLTIEKRTYEVSLKKGGQTDALLFGVVGTEAAKPFVTEATVIGKLTNNVIIADEIHVLPIGDATQTDNPKLPRYLVIGDSISGNYDKGLRAALKGKFNVHHPPTNCGPSSKGRAQIVSWLGAYETRGRHWDVISFNFGHWDAGNDKATYQGNLEAVIGQLKKTGAKLIFVTTCPVPKGYPPAGDLTAEGKAPRRTSGVMSKYLNPWALEVMNRHPQIVVCGQWQFVKKHSNDIYKDWWIGRNVHFGGGPAAALGQHLAKHVEKVMNANQRR